MADRIPPLRIVRPSEGIPRRKRPGAAVVLILLYAGLFGAGLWWFKSVSPLFSGRARRTDGTGKAGALPASGARTADSVAPPPPAPRPPAGVPGLAPADAESLARRAALLAGEGLSPAGQKEYVRRIAAEKCTCGCELTVQACLARDRTCSRSPGMAKKIQESLR